MNKRNEEFTNNLNKLEKHLQYQEIVNKYRDLEQFKNCLLQIEEKNVKEKVFPLHFFTPYIQKINTKLDILQPIKANMDTLIQNLYKNENICPECDGMGTYDSSDNSETCIYCHGTGKYKTI